MQRGRNEGLTEIRLQQGWSCVSGYPLLCESIHIRDVVNGVAQRNGVRIVVTGSFSLTGCIGRPIRVRSRLFSP